MKMIQNVGRITAFILASFLGLLSISSAKAAPELIYGGEIVATNIGPLTYTGIGNYPLNQVSGAHFETTYNTNYDPGSNVHVIIRCNTDLQRLIERDPTSSPGSLAIYPGGNGTGVGKVISLTPHTAGDNIVTIPADWSNNQLRISLHHVLTLRVYSLDKPFSIIQDALFVCAAFRNMSGSAKELTSVTYYTLRVTNLATVAVPSISAPATLDLGRCLARSSEVLSKSIPVKLSHEGQHDTLVGTLTARVTGDTDNLTITTESGHNLTQLFPNGVNIPSAMNGDYPLKVSVPCPDTAGTYNWSALLTYTIE